MTIFNNILLLFLLFLPREQLPNGFVYLQNHIPDITLDIRYFSSDNFVGDTIDGYHNKRCIISIEAANALAKVQNDLNLLGYGLKVFDGYRPQQAVNHFVRWAKDIDDNKMKSKYYPEVDKQMLFQKGYISSRSGHTRGSTIDLTIIYKNGPKQGEELDMGTPWDFFSLLSWPSSNEVTSAQKANRMLLQKIMKKYGFKPYKAEWWHFTLVDEPYPNKYFDFPVK